MNGSGKLAERKDTDAITDVIEAIDKIARRYSEYSKKMSAKFLNTNDFKNGDIKVNISKEDPIVTDMLYGIYIMEKYKDLEILKDSDNRYNSFSEYKDKIASEISKLISGKENEISIGLHMMSAIVYFLNIIAYGLHLSINEENEKTENNLIDNPLDES